MLSLENKPGICQALPNFTKADPNNLALISLVASIGLATILLIKIYSLESRLSKLETFTEKALKKALSHAQLRLLRTSIRDKDGIPSSFKSLEETPTEKPPKKIQTTSEQPSPRLNYKKNSSHNKIN